MTVSSNRCWMVWRKPRDMQRGTPSFAGFCFDNRYARLPELFYHKQEPLPVTAPQLIQLNEKLAAELGLDASALRQKAGITVLAGNRVPEGAEPLAMAYAGHQFGHFVPQLGDGRALLVGQHRAPDGRLVDVHLKGVGQTPFSRRGDGRSAIGPVIREYIVSEAMHALGIATTRSLAAIATGEDVYRERPLPGGILTRVAQSHVRVGTFEYFAARGDKEGLKALADECIAVLYPDAATAPSPYLALLEQVVARQATLVAKWMGVGFIHGVMNTDNMAISGETIDYGPCAFMDQFASNRTFSSIDSQGRYAYDNQPRIAQWNLARLAETLLPLLEMDTETAIAEAGAGVHAFQAQFKREWLAVMRHKLGLQTEQESDLELIESLLELMQAQEADFTLTFRALCHAQSDATDFLTLLNKQEAAKNWLTHWQKRLATEPTSTDEPYACMQAANPVYIPRNHQIEQAIREAVEQQGYTKMAELLEVLSEPFTEREAYAAYALPPTPQERVYQTFCGT